MFSSNFPIPPMGGGFGMHSSLRRFDEYYRCFPVGMMPGPERENLDHGGKVIMPASALDKLTRLHVTYPMLFELINGAAEKRTHAGVLEFIAEEGKIYIPQWLMRVLSLEAGDLLQVKSTDLPSGQFIKLQAQSTDFLEISDPKAVLEQCFRNFSCLTTGDIFTFSYNDHVYEMAVLEAKPDNDKKAVCVLETDLEVDFAPPIGYEEPQVPSKKDAASRSGTSTPGAASIHGTLHHSGTMSAAINYAAIAPATIEAQSEATKKQRSFVGEGRKLNARSSKSGTSTPPSSSKRGTDTSTEAEMAQHPTALHGPQPLRLRPGKLFFGYAITPVKKRDEGGKPVEEKPTRFQGTGQSLRPTKKKGGSSEKFEK